MANIKFLLEKEDTIEIKKSPTADTRTCDWSKVTKEELLKSSTMHINDVIKGMSWFAKQIEQRAKLHDHDKVSDIDGFHNDFSTGFQSEIWYKNHKKVNRHHIADNDGVPKDVDLLDVIEYVTDCVMAGMARSGHIYTLELSNELLQKAFQNTVEKFKSVVKIKDPLEK